MSWNAKSLSTLLDELKAKGITITFFVSGDWSKENGELLGRMVRDGHELGVMGMNPLEDGDADWVEEDVIAAIEAVNASSGVRPSLYYSGGRSVQPSGKAAARLGILQVLCTVDLLSARGNAQDMLTRALEKPFEGSIILMQPTAEAVRALPACMEGLANKGYAITTVSGVL